MDERYYDTVEMYKFFRNHTSTPQDAATLCVAQGVIDICYKLNDPEECGFADVVEQVKELTSSTTSIANVLHRQYG